MEKHLFAQGRDAITRLGNLLVALCGMAHLSINDGDVYLLEEKPGPRGSKKRQWVARRWRVLPGAPVWAVQKSPTQLEIGCYSGHILLDADGSILSVLERRVGD